MPSLGGEQPIGPGNVDVPMIAARAGGGVNGAVIHIPDWTKVWLVRFSGPAKAVPMPAGAQAFGAGVAAGPEGRPWVYYADKEHLYVTRTSKTVTGFEPVQTLSFPGPLGTGALPQLVVRVLDAGDPVAGRESRGCRAERGRPTPQAPSQSPAGRAASR